MPFFVQVVLVVIVAAILLAILLPFVEDVRFKKAATALTVLGILIWVISAFFGDAGPHHRLW